MTDTVTISVERLKELEAAAAALPILKEKLKKANHSDPERAKAYNKAHPEKAAERVFAIRASSEKCHNQSYFLRLSSAMTDNNVVRSFYDFLMTRDITGRDWCNPPITVALQSWKTECMPRLEPFIDYFKANNETPCEVLSSRLYTLYLEWCELMDEESLTVTSFGLEMKHINFISKGRNTNGIFYKFI